MSDVRSSGVARILSSGMPQQEIAQSSTNSKIQAFETGNVFTSEDRRVYIRPQCSEVTFLNG